MKAISPILKTLVAVVVLVAGSVKLPAQTIEYLNSNNVKAGIGTGGNLFTTTLPTSIWSLFETPPGSGKTEVFTAALWLGGFDNTGVYHCAGNRYFDYGTDYFDGPVSSNYNSNYDQYYKRVFKVNKAQIAGFRSLIFPVTAAQVDSAILFWPGERNPSVLSNYGVSIDSPLAPFIDVNSNGVYEPLLGDYPAIPGDQGIFFVFNDIRSAHTEGGGTAIGVEIRGLASSFLNAIGIGEPAYKNAINNSVFIQYEIQNKSHQTFPVFHLGMYVDPDIGCFDNDFVGCDTTRGLMFAYNGVPYDPDCAPELGYDSVPVALGVQVLSLPLNVFLYFKGQDATAPAQSDPVTVGLCSVYRYYAQGDWGDGTPIEYGHTGYNSGGSPTAYCFPGDPTDSTQWSESAGHMTPGDRRMLGVTNALNFVPGQTLHYDLGYTSAYDPTSNHLSIVDSLKNETDSVKAFYLHRVLHSQQASGIYEVSGTNTFTVSIYPNPTNNNITIESTDIIQTIQLMDIEGRVLLHKTIGATKTILPVNTLAKGVYLLNVQGVGASIIRKIVVE